MIFRESSLRAAMMKSKSLVVSTIFILVMVALDFFREEGFRGETFLFFRGSFSYLDGVTSPCFCSTPVLFISSSSPPQSCDIEVVFPKALLRSCTSSIFFVLLGSGVSCAVSRLSGLNISAGSAGIRRSIDQSLVISSRSSSVSF
jgi:hypothetical protein